MLRLEQLQWGQDVGKVNDGLGDTGSINRLDTSVANPTSVVVSRTVYRVYSSPGAVFSVTCSASASAYAASGAVTASVAYQAAAYPITLTLSGTTKDKIGNANILVGQSCTATLNGIPSALQPYTTYAWSVSGTTFQSWSPTTPAFPNAKPPTLANPNASYEVDGPGPLTNSTASWFWDDNLGSGKSKTETVTCTATVTPPAGQGAAIPVTVTQRVSVYVPNWWTEPHFPYQQRESTFAGIDQFVKFASNSVGGK